MSDAKSCYYLSGFLTSDDRDTLVSATDPPSIVQLPSGRARVTSRGALQRVEPRVGLPYGVYTVWRTLHHAVSSLLRTGSPTRSGRSGPVAVKEIEIFVQVSGGHCRGDPLTLGVVLD